jgi:HAD superfamily hydrolase (TIGR01509 family)
VPFERVRELIGKGGDKLLKEVANLSDESPLGKRITAARAELFLREYLPQLRAFPKARDLLLRLRQDGYTLVAATSAKSTEANALLDVCGAIELVHAQTSSDEADNSKPDPDIIRAALGKAGVAAQAALMLGDTPYDITAARRAGVGTVALRSGGWDDTALAGATAIYDDCADLLAKYTGSPFAR